MCKISIIIPVYNTGNFLNRCIGSVLNQSLNDIELILIDDGSTDNSGEICDFYASKDNRVRVIHKKNEGVSIARNTGIATARGEYIGFIDSDDWIETNMFERMYIRAVEYRTAIIMCDATTIYDDKSNEIDTITGLNNDCLLNKQEISPRLLMEMAGAVWRCIYKKELLIKNNIAFKEKLKFSEDRIFNILAMGYANSIYYMKQSFYNRYIRKGSAVNKYYDNMIDIVLDARKGIIEALDLAWDGEKEYKTAYEAQAIGLSYASINNEFYKDSHKSFIDKYKNVKRICKIEELRNAIKLLNRRDVRSRLIMLKMPLLLCFIAIYLNKKYGR